MPAAPRVIVTRPAAQAGAWVQGLQAQGLQVQSFPLIEISAALHSERRALLQARVLEAGEFAVCMWVSANAVHYFFQSNRAAGHLNIAQAAIKLVANMEPIKMPRLRHWATGPGTVQALAAHGVPVERIDAPDAQAAQWDSEALWARVHTQVQTGCKVLILRGEDVGTPSASREWLGSQVRAAGGEVEFAAVYQRRAPHFSPQQTARAQQAASDGSVWVFSSSQAVAHLPRWASAQGGGIWSQARCIATHPRIAQAAQALGFAVVCTSRPSVQDVAQSIKSLA
jgi:uroporphyrinogen-III synthase